MSHLPYVRLRPEDLDEEARITGWADASAELLEALGLPRGRALPLPLAGRAAADQGPTRRRVREGFVTLLALDPSHPDRTLYLEALQVGDPGFEGWLSRRVGRAFAKDRPELALREAVAAVNLRPGRAESRFNLGLLLIRLNAGQPSHPRARRWAALARGEFARAAELSPELFWGYYHRGVLAYEASLPEIARADWIHFLERCLVDKPAPRDLDLRLLPLESCGDSQDLPGLAYAVLLDLLGLPASTRPTQSLTP